MEDKYLLKRVGEELLKQFTDLYSTGDEVHLLLDDDSFFSVLERVKIRDVPISEDSFRESLQYFCRHLNELYSDSEVTSVSIKNKSYPVKNRSLVYLAFAAYQVKVITANLDDSAIRTRIVDHEKISDGDVRDQRNLWYTVRQLFFSVGFEKFKMPDTEKTYGPGSFVQYPKAHRVFTAAELRECRKFFDKVTSNDFGNQMCSCLHRTNLTQQQENVLHRFYNNWLENRPKIKYSNKPKSTGNNRQSIELQLCYDDSDTWVIVQDGIRASESLFSDMGDDDYLIFYLYENAEFYRNSRADGDVFYYAVLIKQNSKFACTYFDRKQDVDVQGKNRFSIIIFSPEDFEKSEFSGTNEFKTPENDLKIHLSGGILIENRKYAKNYLPLVISRENTIELHTANHQKLKSLQIKDGKFDLNTIEIDLEKSNFSSFYLCLENGLNRVSFSIEYADPEQNVVQMCGWNSLLQPTADDTMIANFKIIERA